MAEKKEPQEAFRQWFWSLKGRTTMLEWMKVNDWSWEWLKERAKDAYLWLADPENPKRFKKRFGPFFLHWCRLAVEIKIDKEHRQKLMSAEQEKQYYEAKRRGGGVNKGFEKAGDL